MADGGVAAIDWSAPWFGPWRGAGEVAHRKWQGGLPVAQALNEGVESPVRFVPPGTLGEGAAYESHVFATRECPTRDNLHDFFNGLAWTIFPRAKRRLNEVQATHIARAGIGATRGPVRDAITLLDENGALLHAPTDIWDALVAREWQRLFVELRPLWTQARLVVFGHALLEKLAMAPRKELTAHVLRAPAPAEGLDDWLAGKLEEAFLAGKPFTPLPVLGVPGWWAGNQNFSFYDDSFVFRAATRAHGLKTTTRSP